MADISRAPARRRTRQGTLSAPGCGPGEAARRAAVLGQGIVLRAPLDGRMRMLVFQL